jgi:hypothetical protein
MTEQGCSHGDASHLESSIFLGGDITSCLALKFNRSFTGTRNLHSQSGINIETRNQHEAGKSFMLVPCVPCYSVLKIATTFFSETSVDF